MLLALGIDAKRPSDKTAGRKDGVEKAVVSRCGDGLTGCSTAQGASAGLEAVICWVGRG